MMKFLRYLAEMAGPRERVLAVVFAVVLVLWAAKAMALTPPVGTLIVNKATAQYGDANGNPRPAVSDTVSVTLSGAPLLRLEQRADSDPVAAGATFNYTIQYQNTGNAWATAVKVVDTLPVNVTFQSASAGGVYNPADRTVTWNLGNLASGSGGSLTITVKAAAALAVGTTLVSRAAASSGEGMQASAVLTTTIGVGPNLILTKSGSHNTVGPSGIITYNLSYRNIGNANAPGVTITDRIPTATAYVAGSATGGATLTGGVLYWAIGDLAPGGQGTLGFSVRVSPLAVAGQQISNVAGIVSAEQTRTSNTVVTAVSTQALILLTMETTDQVRAGANLTYTLQVENTGAVPLTGVVLSNPLPVGTTFVAADSGGVLTAGGGQVDWTIGTLAAGEKKTVSLTVQVDRTLPDGHLIENAASVTTNETGAQTVRKQSRVIARTPGQVALFDAAWQPAYGYRGGDTIYVQVIDQDQNIDPTVAETVSVVLTLLIGNQTIGDTETVILTETGPDTGIFRGSIATTEAATATESGTLTVSPDSRLRATYTDPLDAAPISTASALIDPLGIVFDSVTGNPLAGAVVTLRHWNSVANACDPTSRPVLPPGQVNPALSTGADGRFAFPLGSPGDFCFEVKPPAGYAFPSAVANADLPAGYTIGSGSRGEKFTLKVGDPELILDIPVDPPVGRLVITKSAGKTKAAIGDLVAYSLKLTNSGAAPVRGITVTDVLPHGLYLLPGSSRLNGAFLADPTAMGNRAVAWSIATLAPGQSLEITYRAVVGPDAQRGDGVNRVSAAGISVGRKVASHTASVKVKIRDGIFTAKGTILGKVFLDRDGNRMQNQGGQPDEPGIPDVAIYLEDGTRVITDKNGKFSLLGVAPGTRVLRVDQTTLPRGLVLVPMSNRFLGDGASQIVAMKRGGLVQADFAVRRLKPQTDEPPPVAPTGEKRAAGAAKPPDAFSEAGSVSAAKPSAQPMPTDINVPSGSAPAPPAGEKADATPLEEGAVTMEGEVPAQPETPAQRDWAEDIRAMTPELDILSPAAGSFHARDQIRVVLKAPFGMEPSLSLNGLPVDARQIGRKIEYERGGVAIIEYIAVRLNAGETNVLQAELKDNFGIVRGTKRITVTAAGEPELILIRTDRAEVPADGETRVAVTVELRDRQGRIAPYDGLVTVSVSAGEILEKDADPNAEEFQIALREGIGRLTVRAPRETGEALITAAVDGRRETAKLFFAPHRRSLFLVGLGEVTIGRGQGSGTYNFRKRSQGVRFQC